jgi:two-component system chemotaxis response regulator CheY
MKVLVVDDDVVSRMVLMHLIDAAGGGSGVRFEVLEAEDGEDAWRQLDAGAEPVVLFCDLRMPRLSGMELLARVKADPRFDAMRFVLASAAGDAATMEQALGLGADGYVVKPFDEAKLRTHLDWLLGGRTASPAPAAAVTAADELPHEAARRLGIDRDRLLLYLGGLRRQLDEAAPEIVRLLEAGQPEAARARLVRLAEGCRTLGLWGAAADLDAQGTVPERDKVTRTLETAVASILCRIGTLQGLAHPAADKPT